MDNSTELKSILLLAANPKGTSSLRLQEEEREIKERLRLAGYGKTPINSTVASRPRDVQQAMLDFKPQIVHFTGHGNGEDGLVFEDAAGNPQLINAVALANLFKLFSESVECVVLNACYSHFQAEAIAEHIDYVIGMGQAIGDRSAIDFSVGFYTALGAGRTIEFAYNLGCNAIQLGGHREHSTPVLIAKKPGQTAPALPVKSSSPDQVKPTPFMGNKPEPRENNWSSPVPTKAFFGLSRKSVLALLGIPTVLLGAVLINQTFNSPLAVTSLETANVAVGGDQSPVPIKDNSNYLIGQWDVEEACSEENWRSKSLVTFLSNKSLTSQGEFSLSGVDNGQATEIIWFLIASGVWELNDDRLIVTVSDLRSQLQTVKVNGSAIDIAQLDSDRRNQLQNIFQEMIPQNIAVESVITELNEGKMVLQSTGSACPQISEYIRASK